MPGAPRTGPANRRGLAWQLAQAVCAGQLRRGREERREDPLLSFPLPFLFLSSPLGTLPLIIYRGGHLSQLTVRNVTLMLLKYRSTRESNQHSHASSDKDSEQNGQHSPKKVSKGQKKTQAQAGWRLKAGATRQGNAEVAHASLNTANFCLSIRPF